MNIESELLGHLTSGYVHCWHDGPMIWELTSDKTGQLFLAYLYDNDIECDQTTGKVVKSKWRYFLLETNRTALDAMLDSKVDIRTFFFTTPNIYIHSEEGFTHREETTLLDSDTLQIFLEGVPEPGVYLHPKENE